MLVGRIIYGLGGESVFVGIDILATKWFKGAEMGLAYGIIQALGQVSRDESTYISGEGWREKKGYVSERVFL